MASINRRLTENLREYYTTGMGGMSRLIFAEAWHLHTKRLYGWEPAAFFIQTGHKVLDGLADVRDIGGAEPLTTFMEFKPKVTYRLDESYVQRLMLMRMIGGQDG